MANRPRNQKRGAGNGRRGAGNARGHSGQGKKVARASRTAPLAQPTQPVSSARPAQVHSWLANPRETRSTLERFGLYTKHALGQNFLVNDEVIGHILDLAQLGPTDSVFEVGPGIGTLTVALLRQAGAVVSVEADRDLPLVLAETCAQDSDHFALIQGDALKVGVDQLHDALAGLGIPGVPPDPTKLVSNLPYQVAATLVLGTFEHLPSVGRVVVMVQAEVADRMCAVPGNRQYGAYTAKLGLWAKATGRFEVAPHNFMPAPHVNSAVVRLDRDPAANPTTGEPLSPAQLQWTATVIDSAFAQRRKTIRNSMSATGFQKDDLDRAFEQAGIDGRSRAEKLGVGDFVRLSLALPSTSLDGSLQQKGRE